jgi:hypothetical protein
MAVKRYKESAITTFESMRYTKEGLYMRKIATKTVHGMLLSTCSGLFYDALCGYTMSMVGR